MVQGDRPKNTRRRFQTRKVKRFQDALALCCVDFPIYHVSSINERYIVIAGGGGSSKTGVHNQINVLELTPSDVACVAELVTKYLTPKDAPDAVMTASLILEGSTRLVTCSSKNIIIYNLNYDVDSCSYLVNSYESLVSPQVRSEIKSIKHVSESHILTGGVDGSLVSWDTKYPGDDKVRKCIKVHSKEIDETDVDPITGQVVTLSRSEGRYIIWDLNSCKLIKEFRKDIINDKSQASPAATSNVSYNYRSCRYSYDMANIDSSESYLLVVCNPAQPKGSSLLYKWSTANSVFKIISWCPITRDSIMSMNVSRDGRLAVFGTRSGSVTMFDVKTMKQLYMIENAHHNAVTCLEILPPKKESLILANSQLNPFISVSIDRQVILHRPKRGSIVFKITKLLIVSIVILLAFAFVKNQISDNLTVSDRNVSNGIRNLDQNHKPTTHLDMPESESH